MSYTNGLGSLQGGFNTQDVAATSGAAAAAKTSATATQSTTSSPGLDNTKLSSAGALLANALSGSDVRFDKVAALQGQIAAGTYSVPASDVADKILGSLLT